MNLHLYSFVGLTLVLGSLTPSLVAQTTQQAATFGQIINLGYSPSDIVLDESRGYLYLVNTNSNRIDVISTTTQKLVRSILVGTTPLAAAMSPDNSTLYVTNTGVSTVSIIDLNQNAVTQTVAMPAKPQGIAVGGDGRALVSTLSTATSLLILDKTQAAGQELLTVLTPPTASTPTQIGSSSVTRPTLAWNSKLIATPDGQFIIGLTTPTTTTTYLFVFEVASGTIINSRSVTGQSTVLSVSPDGSRFMAGFTLYDTATLGVIAQANNANAPWTIANPFNVQTNVGGSVFSPDGTKIYSAFNNALTGTPTPPPQSSTLFVNDSTALGIQLGIRLPENILARMVMTADGTKAWSLSQSGVTYLPLSTLYNNPILQLSSPVVYMSQNPCNPGLVTGTLQVLNAGQGTLDFGVNIPTTASLTYRVTTGVAPSTITFQYEPGRAGETRQPGTNLITGGGTSVAGNPIDVTLYSTNAVNIAPNIRVYMNYRQADQRGVTYPVPQMPNANATAPLTGTTGGNEGLWDIVLDSTRNLAYITNSGYNRIEVFDTVNRVFLNPIPVGQMPHEMALSSDSNTLYVGNTGGENISIVDLKQMAVVGKVAFPAIPRQGGGTTATVSNPRALAYGYSGLQFLLAAGTAGTASQWEVFGNNATIRAPDTVTATTAGTNVLPAPWQMMMASADASTILTFDGTGSGYVYNALNDQYVVKVSGLITTPITGFYVPLGVAPDGSYFTIGRFVFNNSLTELYDVGTARNTVATYPMTSNTYIRLSTPVKSTITTTPADDPRPLIDLINFQTGAVQQLAVSAENPRFTLLGTTRYNVSPRQMVVDSNYVAYILTISGLTVIPLTPNGVSTPALTAKGIVNATDGTQNIQPGSFININGSNLASTSAAATTPPPIVLGGSCVTFNDVPLQILQSSANQIVAQVPTNIVSGTNVVVVHSLDNAQSSTPVMITVQNAEGSSIRTNNTGAQ